MDAIQKQLTDEVHTQHTHTHTAHTHAHTHAHTEGGERERERIIAGLSVMHAFPLLTSLQKNKRIALSKSMAKSQDNALVKTDPSQELQLDDLVSTHTHSLCLVIWMYL